MGQHGAHGALFGRECGTVLAHDPVAAQLQVHQVTLFQINDLVSDARQGHGIAGQKVLCAPVSNPQDQRRTGACTHHAVRFVLVHHGDGVGAMQLGHGGLHGVEQVAAVVAVHQVGDDFGVGLAHKHIAACLQRLAQFFVVFNDAVVHQGYAACALGLRVCASAVAEVRVGVVHGGRAMGGPAGVGNAGGTVDVFGGHLLQQLSHAGGAAGALQACRARCIEAGGMYRHAAGVIAPVFKPLQALDEDGNDVARRDRADDAAHGVCPWVGFDGRIVRSVEKNYRLIFQ
ncbi:hypothetical protein D3C71_958130 [compost metagenome]